MAFFERSKGTFGLVTAASQNYISLFAASCKFNSTLKLSHINTTFNIIFSQNGLW